jgi:hypothetical protein
LEAVSHRLGHSTVRTTADLYGSFIPELDRATAETVAALY